MVQKKDIRDSLAYVAAPMVNQSDLPFRLLTRKYGATLAYTQMLHPEKILADRDYLEFHQRDLSLSQDFLARPVVVQLCGNDPELLVRSGRALQSFCDGIDLNLGCPQEHAKEGHYGAYLLGHKDWPLVENIVSCMSHSFTVPVSAKLRLCQPAEETVELASRLEASGASWITLHARHVSARRRRQGSADLDEVKRLKAQLRVPVVSNGNVRVWSDIGDNLRYTSADGVMVGETLLGNPCIFSNKVADPVSVSLEYLRICREYPDVVAFVNIRKHVEHFIRFQCSRRAWYPKFRARLRLCATIDDVETVLRNKVTRWRGRATQMEDDSCSYSEREGDVDVWEDDEVLVLPE